MGLFIAGLVCGYLLNSFALLWGLVTGRITSYWIAEQCDRLIGEVQEPTEGNQRSRTL